MTTHNRKNGERESGKSVSGLPRQPSGYGVNEHFALFQFNVYRFNHYIIVLFFGD